MAEPISIDPASRPAGPMGWEIPAPNASTSEKLYVSKAQHGVDASARPYAYTPRTERVLLPDLQKAWDDFQDSHGRARGSNDMTLFPEFIFGEKNMHFLPQDNGTCVYSNPFRGWIDRMCYEICLGGDPEAYTGRLEFGIGSIAPHCVLYGMAREIAGMKGPDGLYCAPMVKAMMQGIILCSTPKLIELNKAAGANTDEDYPEPRSQSLYRKIGDWAWNSALKPYLCCELLEASEVTNLDQHIAAEDASKPIIQCSGIAIKKISVDKDGFDIHSLNPGDSWSHAMVFRGKRINSQGRRYHRLSNTSWTPKGEDQQSYVYNISDEELDSWYKKGLVDSRTIGEINGLPIVYPGL